LNEVREIVPKGKKRSGQQNKRELISDHPRGTKRMFASIVVAQTGVTDVVTDDPAPGGLF